MIPWLASSRASANPKKNCQSPFRIKGQLVNPGSRGKRPCVIEAFMIYFCQHLYITDNCVLLIYNITVVIRIVLARVYDYYILCMLLSSVFLFKMTVSPAYPSNQSDSQEHIFNQQFLLIIILHSTSFKCK